MYLLIYFSINNKFVKKIISILYRDSNISIFSVQTSNINKYLPFGFFETVKFVSVYFSESIVSSEHRKILIYCLYPFVGPTRYHFISYCALFSIARTNFEKFCYFADWNVLNFDFRKMSIYPRESLRFSKKFDFEFYNSIVFVFSEWNTG